MTGYYQRPRVWPSALVLLRRTSRAHDIHPGDATRRLLVAVMTLRGGIAPLSRSDLLDPNLTPQCRAPSRGGDDATLRDLACLCHHGEALFLALQGRRRSRPTMVEVASDSLSAVSPYRLRSRAAASGQGDGAERRPQLDLREACLDPKQGPRVRTPLPFLCSCAR